MSEGTEPSNISSTFRKLLSTIKTLTIFLT